MTSLNHPLRRWRVGEKLTLAQAAGAIGRQRATWHGWEWGNRTPGPDDLKAIYVLTRGKVQPNDFHDLPAWEAERIRVEAEAELARRAA